MRRHVDIPALGHESLRVESFISAHRYRLRARQLLQHHQRRVALRRPVGLEHFRPHDQTVAVLHQQIPAVTQLRLLARSFARQLRLGISLRFMAVIRPLLAVKVYRRVARIIRRRSRLLFSGLKALGSRPSLQQCPVYREMLIRGQALRTRLRHHPRQELLGHIGLQQPIAILGKRSRIPHLVIRIQAHKPTEQ